ncbi:hypothetical protein ACLOJK_036008 [Asimina triloba]
MPAINQNGAGMSAADTKPPGADEGGDVGVVDAEGRAGEDAGGDAIAGVRVADEDEADGDYGVRDSEKEKGEAEEEGERSSYGAADVNWVFRCCRRQLL